MLHAPCERRGFTLIELLVSIAIFTIITGLVFVSQSRFGGTVLITNLAYDVALTVRQAQVYGISTRKVQGVPDSLGQFNRSYGIHVGPTGYFVLFADINQDGRYDTSSDNGTGCLPNAANPECVSFFKIQQGNTISSFCGGSDCKGSANDSLDILFHRPEPEPTINGFFGATAKSYGNASIKVSSPQGLFKSVCISASGQIYIKQSCP